MGSCLILGQGRLSLTSLQPAVERGSGAAHAPMRLLWQDNVFGMARGPPECWQQPPCLLFHHHHHTLFPHPHPTSTAPHPTAPTLCPGMVLVNLLVGIVVNSLEKVGATS